MPHSATLTQLLYRVLFHAVYFMSPVCAAQDVASSIFHIAYKVQGSTFGALHNITRIIHRNSNSCPNGGHLFEPCGRSRPLCFLRNLTSGAATVESRNMDEDAFLSRIPESMNPTII